MNNWLTERPTYWLIDWLIGQLSDWPQLTDWLTDRFSLLSQCFWKSWTMNIQSHQMAQFAKLPSYSMPSSTFWKIFLVLGDQSQVLESTFRVSWVALHTLSIFVLFEEGMQAFSSTAKKWHIYIEYSPIIVLCLFFDPSLIQFYAFWVLLSKSTSSLLVFLTGELIVSSFSSKTCYTLFGNVTRSFLKIHRVYFT